MYVCICKAVTERQIYAAIKAGAHSLKELRRKLGIIDECGQCASSAKHCLRKACQERANLK